MHRFGVVFVMFHPDDVALANLARAREDCSDLVMVDNTPEPDVALHGRLSDDGMTILANCNAGGLAGAYNRGFELLLARGCEVMFVLDQDSEIEAGFFERMTAATESMTDRRFVVAPWIYETALDRYFPQLEGVRPGEPGPLHDASIVISSGSAVSAEAYHSLGAFREDLFIEYIDTEYSMRAHRLGVPVLVNPSEVLRQHTGAITVHGRRYTTNHVAWRRYYLVRNIIGVSRGIDRSLPPVIVGGTRIIVREIGTVLLFESDKLRKLVAILTGAADGFRIRLGRFENNHPRTQRFCTRTPRTRLAHPPQRPDART